MKIALGSDLHLEHFKDSGTMLVDCVPDVPDCDLVVLAGDIWTGDAGLYWASMKAGDTPVIYVPGNHEYYGWPYERLAKVYDDFDDDNVMLLNPGTVEMEDIVFIGATLRSALVLPGYTMYPAAAYQRAIGDFQVTPGWNAEKHVEQHLREVAYIEEQLIKYADKKRVVITHFVPTV